MRPRGLANILIVTQVVADGAYKARSTTVYVKLLTELDRTATPKKTAVDCYLPYLFTQQYFQFEFTTHARRVTCNSRHIIWGPSFRVIRKANLPMLRT
jgi:hypothetical protein